MPITPSQLHDPIVAFVQPAGLTLSPADTIATALERARLLPATQVILYCYVVDQEKRLVGVVPIRRLLTTAPEGRIDSIMIHDVEAIPSWATVLVAAEYFVNRRFLAFPVVEPGGRLVGVVDVSLFTDDVLELARRSFDGIFQIIGVHATEGRTAWTSFLDRFPWLLCNVAGGLLCALLASRYEGLLDHLVVLALFIPVVLTLAESVSIQSVTLTLQNLSDGPINWRVFARGFSKEFLTALMLGLGCGTLVGLSAFVWKGAVGVGLVLTLAITVAMITACLLGVLMPTALRALKADPKIAAGPIVLALTDVATLLFYFNLAGMLLR
ncbi:MAG: magnesium transporter [Vicinamibacteria bacterium]|nr:magnesium transporter [Vicinamibacteria bacterium]